MVVVVVVVVAIAAAAAAVVVVVGPSSSSSSSSCCCCCKQLSCHKGARNYTKYVSIFISAKEVICDHVGSFACLFVCMRAG